MYGYENESLKGTIAKPHGKVRGLVVDPLDVFELLRDTYTNTPIPKDAKFEAVSIEKAGAGSIIAFYFSAYSAGNEMVIIKPTDVNLDPMMHCVALKPQLFVDILKHWFNGDVPSDAEVKAFYINHFFSLLCIEVSSDKFPDYNGVGMPMIHLRYEGGQLYTMNPDTKTEQRNIIQ